MSRKVEEGDGDRNLVCKYYGKKERESLSRLSLSEFKLTTNKTLGYDMPIVLMVALILQCCVRRRLSVCL